MYRRHGGEFETMQANAHWTEAWYDRIHDESYIRLLADLGFNCVTTHFHKGFGMAAEAGEMALAREVIKICHRHGIRVLTYVQSMSIMPETFLAEVPEAGQWLQVDEHDRPRAYAEQYWRLLPCLSHEGYVAYVRKVTEKALQWARADGIWLDNTNFNPCRCEACQASFRASLRQRYPAGDADRFGIPALDAVSVADRGSTCDPIYQESMRFRCRMLVAFVEHMRRFVRSLNPEAAVAANFGAPCPYNHAEVLGVDFDLANRAADIVLAENGNFPGFVDQHALTQILAYKAGHATGTVVIPSHWRLQEADRVILTMPERVEHVKLDLAESAAFGRRCVGATWAARPDDRGRRTFVQRADIRAAVDTFNNFFAHQESLYVGTESLANVATYRNFASEAFTHDQFTGCVLGFEQALIHEQVPFDVLFASNLDEPGRLERYEVLVLANVLCMSDREVERIRTFSQEGGAILATGQTSLFDENYRQRPDFGLADLFETSARDAGGAPSVHRHGRTIFLADTPERAGYNHLNYQMRVALPAAHGRLVRYVRDLCPSGPPVQIEARGPVAVEICGAPETVIVHLVNYDNGHSVQSIDVRLSATIGAGVGTTAQCFNVDSGGSARPLNVERDDSGGCSVRVPLVETYSVIVFQRHA